MNFSLRNKSQRFLTGLLLPVLIVAGSTTAVFLFLSYPALVDENSEVKEPDRVRKAGDYVETVFPKPGPAEVAAETAPPVEDPAVPVAEVYAPPLHYCLEGVIRDLASRRPIKGREFTVQALSPASTRAVPVAEIDSATGEYRFTNLSLGWYTLVVQVKGYRPFWTDLMVPLEGKRDLLLAPAYTVKVRVTDGRARRLRRVRFRSLDICDPATPAVLSVYEDHTGYVVQNLPAGERELAVEAPGFEPRRLRIHVSPIQPFSYWTVFE